MNTTPEQTVEAVNASGFLFQLAVGQHVQNEFGQQHHHWQVYWPMSIAGMTQ